MNTCICIPARINSSRLNNKLLIKFNINGIERTCIELTYLKCIECKNVKDIFILTDSDEICNIMSKYTCNIIKTELPCINGTERISKYLNQIPERFTNIVNVQADEPFINYENIDFAIEKHIQNNEDNLFYTTLHEQNNDDNFLRSTSSLKLVTDNNNNVLYYSRNIIPWNKDGQIMDYYKYKCFTGIYVFNRDKLRLYKDIKDTPLQLMEDCEQLKILENGYKIKSFVTVKYNEISLNTIEDYDYLKKKYVDNLKTNYNNNIKNINSKIEIRKNTNEEILNKNKINEKIKNIKFVVFDLDGVFTDGKIYVLENQHMKCYNGKDTYALKLLLQNGYKTGLITAHDSTVLQNMEHIVTRMDYVSKGHYQKTEVLNNWLSELNFKYENVAYIGDDLPDLPILKLVGFSACPNNAVSIIKENVDYICREDGGNGSVREFVELILNINRNI